MFPVCIAVALAVFSGCSCQYYYRSQWYYPRQMMDANGILCQTIRNTSNLRASVDSIKWTYFNSLLNTTIYSLDSEYTTYGFSNSTTGLTVFQSEQLAMIRNYSLGALVNSAEKPLETELLDSIDTVNVSSACITSADNVTQCIAQRAWTICKSSGPPGYSPVQIFYGSNIFSLPTSLHDDVTRALQHHWDVVLQNRTGLLAFADFVGVDGKISRALSAPWMNYTLGPLISGYNTTQCLLRGGLAVNTTETVDFRLISARNHTDGCVFDVAGQHTCTSEYALRMAFDYHQIVAYVRLERNSDFVTLLSGQGAYQGIIHMENWTEDDRWALLSKKSGQYDVLATEFSHYHKSSFASLFFEPRLMTTAYRPSVARGKLEMAPPLFSYVFHIQAVKSNGTFSLPCQCPPGTMSPTTPPQTQPTLSPTTPPQTAPTQTLPASLPTPLPTAPPPQTTPTQPVRLPIPTPHQTEIQMPPTVAVTTQPPWVSAPTGGPQVTLYPESPESAPSPLTQPTSQEEPTSGQQPPDSHITNQGGAAVVTAVALCLVFLAIVSVLILILRRKSRKITRESAVEEQQKEKPGEMEPAATIVYQGGNYAVLPKEMRAPVTYENLPSSPLPAQKRSTHGAIHYEEFPASPLPAPQKN